LDPFYRIFNLDRQHFDYFHKIEDTLSEIDRWNPNDKPGYRKFSDQTRKIFDKFHPFTDRPFLKLMDMVKIIPDVIRLQAYSGTYGFASRFSKHPFLKRVFSFHPLLIGGNPFDTPSILR
jgi:phytoene desaturase